MPGSPGPQAISFNTSCEIEIAQRIMQTAGQVRIRPFEAERRPPNRNSGQNQAARALPDGLRYG